MGRNVNRRDLLKYAAVTTAATAGIKAQTSAAAKTRLGSKGKIYPDQRRKYKDSRSGHTVWQMTDTPGRTTVSQYATQPMSTPDGRWLLYGSDRGNAKGQLDIFKMDLHTGVSTQLTDSNRDLSFRWAHISPDGKQVYYVEDNNLFKVIDIETLKERELCRVENCFRAHQLSVSPDNRFIIDGVFLENKQEENFLVGQGFLIRSAIVVISTADGKTHRLCDGNTPRTHAQFCPADPNLILYCYGGPWWYVQRLWLIRPDGSGNRPIFLQTHFEGAGHEFWSDNGKTIYVFANGGRQPQGLWAMDADGGNERCVLAGSCTGHGAANPEEDRFVVTEIFNDFNQGLWIARKGSTEPQLLCQTGTDPSRHPIHLFAHPRFLRDGKTVAFTGMMTGSPELYFVEA
jgi:Tol biopolymer transport system component